MWVESLTSDIHLLISIQQRQTRGKSNVLTMPSLLWKSETWAVSRLLRVPLTHSSIHMSDSKHGSQSTVFSHGKECMPLTTPQPKQLALTPLLELIQTALKLPPFLRDTQTPLPWLVKLLLHSWLSRSTSILVKLVFMLGVHLPVLLWRWEPMRTLRAWRRSWSSWVDMLMWICTRWVSNPNLSSSHF